MIRNFLNSTHRSIAWFKRAFDGNELEMRPPFQRDLVWTDLQKSYLMDTILRGYPIPEIYMQRHTDERGNERHVVVDGQQRIRSCLEFIQGTFTLNPNDSPEHAGMSFDDLGPEDKRNFYGYEFVVRTLPDLADDELRSIFLRLNRNVMALNQQELRHAIYRGEFLQSMERLSEHEFWGESGVFTANDVRRMLDVEFISELAIAQLHGLQNKKTSLDTWYAAYEENFEAKSQVESVFASVLGELTHILPDIARTRWRKKSDFYSLFSVLGSHSKQLPLASEQRKLAFTRTHDFGAQVTEFMKADAAPAAEGDGASEVRVYARAVERAASDLNNRKLRAEALERALSGVWS